MLFVAMLCAFMLAILFGVSNLTEVERLRAENENLLATIKQYREYSNWNDVTLKNQSIYRENIKLCCFRYMSMITDDDPELFNFIKLTMDSVMDEPLQKLNRWLGYIQGVLIAKMYTTVEIERDWTRQLFRPLDYTMKEK